MYEQEHSQITAGYRHVYIDAREFPQVLRFISISKRTIYINVMARKDAKIIKLSFNDRDIFRI